MPRAVLVAQYSKNLGKKPNLNYFGRKNRGKRTVSQLLGGKAPEARALILCTLIIIAKVLAYGLMINKIYIWSKSIGIWKRVIALISFTSYLHERAEESRHSESISLLIAVLGAVLFVGGISVTLATTSSTQWFLIIPYQLNETSGVLSVTLTVVGLPLLVFGFGLAIHYSSQRGWYFEELKKAYFLEEDKMRTKSKKNELAKKSQSNSHS